MSFGPVTSQCSASKGHRALSTCGFVTGSGVQNLKIRAKYLLMRLRCDFYPDVYCIPVWLGAKCFFIPEGTRIAKTRFNFLFSELHAGVEQLKYLADLVYQHREKVIVIPGPPEVFQSYAGQEARRIASYVLRNAGHVWAYSDGVAKFANEIAHAQVSRVIPWPFDYLRTIHLARRRSFGSDQNIHVLIGVPLRFQGIAENSPHFLEDCIDRTLDQMSESVRRRFRFHAFLYTEEDKKLWQRSKFGSRIGVTLQSKMSYANFLRFVGSCQAVIQVSKFSILGRLTFIAAALGKPGVFSANSELNRRLYPDALVDNPMDQLLKEKTNELLHGLAENTSLLPFLPDVEATKAAGAFKRNASLLNDVLLKNPV